MSSYIDKKSFLTRLEASPLFDNFGEDGEFIKEFVVELIKIQPTADVVEVDVLKEWLYKIALNNVGVMVGDFSQACEEIIARLKYLKVFAKERSENGT